MKKRFIVFFDGSFAVNAENEDDALHQAELKLVSLDSTGVDYDSIEVEADDEDDEDWDEGDVEADVGEQE